MRRRLLNLATVASAVGCLAVAGLWVRSYVAYDFVTAVRVHPGPGQWVRQFYDCRTGRGGMAVRYVSSWNNIPAVIDQSRQAHATELAWMMIHQGPRAYPFEFGGYPQPGVGGHLGFEGEGGWMPRFGNDRVWGVRLVCPYWLPTAVLAVLPVVRVVRRRRRVAGACRSCGYDLRATPGRCPECGTVPAAGDRR